MAEEQTTTTTPSAATAKRPVRRGGKKERRAVPYGRACIQATFNNTIVTITDLSGAIGEAVALHATLTRTIDGMSLGNREVHFWVDGTEIGTDITTKAGIAELDYWIAPAFGVGAHQAAAEFEGDSLYHGSLDIAPFDVSQVATAMAVTDAMGAIGETVPLSARLTRRSPTGP